MKKLAITLLIITAFCVPFVATSSGTVEAVNVLNPVCINPDPTKVPDFCADDSANTTDNPIFGPKGIITRMIELLARIVGVIAVIAIIVYGLKMVSSGSDPGEAKKSRQAIIYALAGVGVAVVAQGLVTFVLNKL